MFLLYWYPACFIKIRTFDEEKLIFYQNRALYLPFLERLFRRYKQFNKCGKFALLNS